MDEVVPLFRDCHIAQIKDYQLELQSDLVKTNEIFQKNLLKNYNKILNLTDAVNDLSLDLKSIDQDFKSLCFNDEKFQLNKLPPLPHHQTTTHITPVGTEDTASIVPQNILVISNWTISISNFCNRISTSTTPSRIFDDLLLNFHELSLTSVPATFETLIKNKCYQLQKFLVDSMETLNFTLLQWVKLYNLLNTDFTSKWDADILSAFNESLFETLFNENVQALLNSGAKNKKHQYYYSNEQNNDPIVTGFVNSSIFKDHLIRRTVKEINTHLGTLSTLIAKFKESDSYRRLDIFHDDNKDHDDNIESALDEATLKQYIETAISYSKGLTNDETLEIYETVQPTIEILQNLETYKCPQETLVELRTKLITQLQDFKTQIEASLPSSSLARPATIVDDFMTHYNNQNLLRLVTGQINQLTR
ncbi:Golgi transport complex subunit COG1 [Saccharomyces eubayanus]|uniref:Golgi transport complex subunit COG1 n=1 Tax=Saccharomyces eubayanus TaxID=1080349 RepID=UPI0006BF3EFF|nr:COG1-like protein [Saccharomyces eubayanus]KOG99312.1 COG1-like protein [Saccharomyces eubayanus]